jgi:casein kinase II subunit beta
MFLFSEAVEYAERARAAHRQSHDSFDVVSESEWIRVFVSQHNWLCAVSDEYVNDNFNLYGLSHSVSHYSEALKLIRGQFDFDDDVPQSLQKEAEILYGLIHSRYIVTFGGVQEMVPLYRRKVFGICPRVACKDHPLLPIGLRPNPGEMTVHTFCHSCQDIYTTDCDLDGSCFGPYFPHLFEHALKDEPRLEAGGQTPASVCGVPIDPAGGLNRCVHG